MKDKRGFTLVEIVITVCLMAVMMALTVPGLMNYFGDVDEDKFITETKSVVARIRTSRSQISLSGSLGSDEINVETANQIVKKAGGNGVIKKLNDTNGIFMGEYWMNDDTFVTFRIEGSDEKYYIGNKEDDDIFS